MSTKKAAAKKTIWMAGSNLSGLWSTQPILGTWDSEFNEYTDKTGNLSVSGIGCLEYPFAEDPADVGGSLLITFSSKNKSDVVIWISGWITAMEQVAARIPK
jgi:hypothetical protein